MEASLSRSITEPSVTDLLLSPFPWPALREPPLQAVYIVPVLDGVPIGLLFKGLYESAVLPRLPLSRYDVLLVEFVFVSLRVTFLPFILLRCFFF